MDHLKVFIEFFFFLHNIASVVCFGFLTTKRGILASLPEINLAPPAMEDKVLTTGQPGKPLGIHF